VDSSLKARASGEIAVPRAVKFAMEKIYVTRPELPPFEEIAPYLKEIWESRVLTNNGPFHQRLEAALCEYLGVKHVSLFTNATIGLITALQALQIAGEVITTPYSFVATAHSLLWNGIRPVFVDVQPDTLNLDPSKIEAAITPQTTAIMPVHCYGNPCDVDAIDAIAKKHNLRVIYDAAHAFGVSCHCGSVLNHGDLSVLSFHATKVFNTFEGGAIICPNAETKLLIDQLKNFGFVDETIVVAAGINGKMSEFNAALGLVQLGHVDAAIAARQRIDRRYREHLHAADGVRCLPMIASKSNYSYFPIILDPQRSLNRDRVYHSMRADNIFARRYFYPLISEFPMYRDLPSSSRSNLPIAWEAAERVLCLPIFPSLTQEDQARVIKHIIG
jgi:dTDP-4-amino-4,6-dideoxygalactose transaminase